jgi:putative MATE family efflux protein
MYCTVASEKTIGGTSKLLILVVCTYNEIHSIRPSIVWPFAQCSALRYSTEHYLTMTTMMEPNNNTWQGTFYSSKFFEEIRGQWKTSLPTICALVLYKFPWLISLRFVGAIGADELAAAALAATLCNVTGLSLSIGLSSALTSEIEASTVVGCGSFRFRVHILPTTRACICFLSFSALTGQARGDLMERHKRKQKQPEHDQQPLLGSNQSATAQYETWEPTDIPLSTAKGTETPQAAKQVLLPMVFLYRGLFVQLVFVIPVGLWWISGIHGFLLALGQSQTVAEMSAAYLKILAPGLWAYSVHWTLTAWLQAIEMADVPAYAAAVGVALHIPINYFFIYGMGWGYLGVATATTLSQIIQPVWMVLYLFATPHGMKRLHSHTMADAVGRPCIISGHWMAEMKLAITSYHGMKKYLGLAIPGIITISEWWASEIAIFLSGRLQPHPEVALGGMTLYQSINTFCFMFPVAAAVAGSARVGSFLGSNEPERAKMAAKVSVLSATMVSAVIGGILYFVPHDVFPSLFTPDMAVVEETSRTIPLLATYVFADGIQCALNGIIKGW